MRRIALFSDIHANLPALEAVLGDMDACGVSERYCLGDLVGYGPWPSETVARIRELHVPTIQGNYDEGIGTRRGECGCYYATEQEKSDGAASYTFTSDALSDEDAAWLVALPSRIRLREGGCRILLAHGSPRKVNEYLLPDRTDSLLARLAGEADADLVCVGHVHIPYHRSMPAHGAKRGGPLVHYVSSGSVGKPKDGDPRTGWVELVLGVQGDVCDAAPGDPAAGPCGPGHTWAAYIVHRLAYDVDLAAAGILAAGLPPAFARSLREA